MTDREHESLIRTSKALLPCPFCASPNVAMASVYGDYNVYCGDCQAQGPNRVARDIAGRDWNAPQRHALETSALQPGEDIAEALERQGDPLSLRAVRHIRIKWNTEEGLRQQLRHTTARLNATDEHELKASGCPTHGMEHFFEGMCIKCGAVPAQGKEGSHGKS